MMYLPDYFWQWQEDYCPRGYVLALSGGLDSVTLLHLLAAQREQLTAPLQACYINHGWHEDASLWGQQCADLCAKLCIDFQQISLALPCTSGVSREAQAREARYQALASILPAQGVLLTAQHRDDQAETLLLQLLRGAGVAGLAGMPLRKAFAAGEHWRPLLSLSRAVLEAYVQQHGLRWIEDPSNVDKQFARNRLRHDVMPVLESAFPNAAQQIARSADWLGETQALLDEVVDAYLDHNVSTPLSWTTIAPLSFAWQKAVIRRWLSRQQIMPPPHQRLVELLRQMRDGNGYAECEYGDSAVVFYRDKLYSYVASEPDEAPVFSWQTAWQGVGDLRVVAGEEALQESSLHWTLYPPGAYFRPLDARHGKALKYWFQRQGIPPFVRRRTPLLWRDDELIWVGGIGAAQCGVPTLVIDWQNQAHSATIPPIFQASD